MCGIKSARIGGILNSIAWTGGSNLTPLIAPYDVQCFRPMDFRSMQEQDKLLK